ncbi:MAG TPA: phosphotransferase [Thermomicrobiales bacterium]|jgi:homoserine kinase type II|nr:phosphotransferase [Thermomicrobiales bacterium]
MAEPELTDRTRGEVRARLSPDLLTAVATAWDLGEINVAAPTEDIGGSYNLNLRLQTDRGEVVVRVYRPWVTPDRLAAVQGLRHALRREAIPTIVPLSRSNGATALEWAGRLVEVEPWVSSESGADSWQRYVTAGAELGRLHAALRRIRVADPFPPAPVSSVIAPSVFADWIARARRAIAAAPLAPGAVDALATCDEAERLRTIITAEPRPGHIVQLTHGDFAHDNVRFFGTSPVAILDFDFIDTRDRITDLAYTTYWMFEHLQWDIPAAERDWWRAGDLVRGYAEASGIPLTAEELVWLPLAMATIPTTWVAETWLMGDVLEAIGLVARQMETVAWLINHRHDLAQMWAP